MYLCNLEQQPSVSQGEHLGHPGERWVVTQGFQPVLVDQEQACPHCDLVGDVSVVSLSVLSLSKQSLVLPGGGGGYSGR